MSLFWSWNKAPKQPLIHTQTLSRAPPFWIRYQLTIEITPLRHKSCACLLISSQWSYKLYSLIHFNFKTWKIYLLMSTPRKTTTSTSINFFYGCAYPPVISLETAQKTGRWNYIKSFFEFVFNFLYKVVLPRNIFSEMKERALQRDKNLLFKNWSIFRKKT